MPCKPSMSSALAAPCCVHVVCCFWRFSSKYSPWHFFNIMLQATQEELKAAYRRLCMLYHPDKHRDPELKRQAEQLFNLVHEAYEGKESFGASSAAVHEADVTMYTTRINTFLYTVSLPSSQRSTITSHLWHLRQTRAGCWRMGGKFISGCRCYWLLEHNFKTFTSNCSICFASHVQTF